MSRHPQRSWLPRTLAWLRHLDVGRVILISSVVLAVVASAFAGLRGLDYRESRKDARADAESATIEATRVAAQSVDALFERIESAVDGLADELTAGRVDDGLSDRLSAVDDGKRAVAASRCARLGPDASELDAALCSAALGITELNGIGVVFVPSADPTTVYRPYANRIEGSLDLSELAALDIVDTD